MYDILFFVALPYVALVLFFLVGITRYRRRPFSVTSLSSQFLENRKHFWSTVPFHYGLIGVLLLHLAGLMIPDTMLAWNAAPVRLLVLEVTGLALGLMALFGLVNAMVRRAQSSRIRVITNKSDWVLLVLLLVQIVLGILVAVYNGWGSSWFATSATPWLWSLFTLNPDLSYVAGMPLLVKLHIINAFLLIGFFPFTRLIHVIVIPNHYLWRKTQVVRWNRDRKRLRIRD
ncbi:MAG: respiratory nitrate reductase subunit gamma [Planctomycetes bacterium]|nr:respiratory nitrate reductase subunit gamma [Planctomycetota bacterium]